MLNGIFVALVAGAVLVAAFRGHMPAANDAAFASAKSAVEVTLGLVGAMALWLGFMRVLRDAGFLHTLARGLAPLLRRLFPDVPADHPALGAIVMNLAANVLGLGNAATPFGVKAMQELETLNPRPGTATDAQALFCAINTASVQLIPATVIALRVSAGSRAPAEIIGATVLASLCGAATAIAAAKLLARFAPFPAPPGSPTRGTGRGRGEGDP